MRLRALGLLLAATVMSPLAAAAPLPKPAPLAAIAAQARIPFEQFTLANGLRVIVSTDRSVPVVATSIWYHVGSKDEPAGKTGFAHLFEHLMFYGSENVPGGIFPHLEAMGATDWNGTTWYDRTNYFETVPTPALERVLFLESDRMGHLLGAVSQQTLDRQRGVVMNEKRQGDNAPYGLVQYAEADALFPADHPYHHSTIGSMDDLGHASLEDVRGWFRSHYGPNNAVLVLAGDIDAPTARRLAQKYFGDIPRGPDPAPVPVSVPSLPAPRAETLYDQVATTRLYREWVVPGWAAPDTVPLDLFGSVLGGLASSRFDDQLVRRDKLAVGASASLESQEKVGIFRIQVDLAPGADASVVNRRIDAILADLIAKGPSQDELARAVTREVSSRLFALESVGGFSGRAVTLAQGAVFAGDPGFYARQLQAYAAATPESVRAAAARWLTRPAYALTVAPGPRPPAEQAKATQDDADKPGAAAAAAQPAASGAAPAAKPARPLPAVGDIVALTYPTIQRARLSNGIPIVFAQRGPLPLTRVVLSFDAGHAADPRAALGTDALMLNLLDQGTTTRSAGDLAADEERYGISIDSGASMDRSLITLAGLSANLAGGLDLLADVTLNPSFADLERVRVQQLTGIKAELADPSGLASRTLPGLIYGDTAYGVPPSGSGDPAAVAKLGKADLEAFKARWVRPDKATIFVVSDRPLAEVQPLLETRFGGWRAAAAPAGAKDLSRPVPAPRNRIVLLDRPGSPQSVIVAGQVLAQDGTDELLALRAANEALGGSITSRLSTDLRETRNWSYGVASGISDYVGRVPFKLVAPVQTDKTGPALKAALDDMTALLGSAPITEDEREKVVASNVRALPGALATAGDILAAMQKNDRLKRPDDYYVHLAGRYRALTAAEMQAALKGALRPGELLWLVVGDAATVRPQLEALGLPVETATPTAR
ncbi:M16 family metallopeptidase [Sphingomonas morindae]|uniref:Insulinase family protein n=1 Tax=Sphingomonas morindae TaxID=1541170 RepID=A0ABY4X900_9SPHN|nr:pitrilysin family protein [Sphingomonas morindae]USI73320.1 insulinase family protein [Sphingomonas morindae]